MTPRSFQVVPPVEQAIRLSGPAAGVSGRGELRVATDRRIPCSNRRIGPVLLRIAATVVVCGLLSATMVRFSPGFGVDEQQLDARLGSAGQQALRQAHDEELNPVWFYAQYMGRMITGNLGFSHSLSRPIGELLAERAPSTADRMVWGVAGAWLLALALAVPPVTWQLSRLATVFTTLSGVSACLPAAGVALVLFRFGVSARWMIPVILFPRLYQYLRNLLWQSYGMPHVLLARAKGLSRVRIFLSHVLAPARGQLIALVAVSVNMAFGAAVAVEAICDLPGLGQLAWKAALARDLPVLVIVTMTIALMTQFSNLVADVCSPDLRRQA